MRSGFSCTPSKIHPKARWLWKRSQAPWDPLLPLMPLQDHVCATKALWFCCPMYETGIHLLRRLISAPTDSLESRLLCGLCHQLFMCSNRLLRLPATGSCAAGLHREIKSIPNSQLLCQLCCASLHMFADKSRQRGNIRPGMLTKLLLMTKPRCGVFIAWNFVKEGLGWVLVKILDPEGGWDLEQASQGGGHSTKVKKCLNNNVSHMVGLDQSCV